MLPVVGLFFLVLLSMILYNLYKNESIVSKNKSRHGRVEEFWTGIERRKYTRFKRTLEVMYSTVKKPLLNGAGHTVDISGGGMKLLLDEKLPACVIMSIKVSVPSSAHDIELDAEVIWCEESLQKETSGKRQFYHGIKFLAIKEPSGTRLGEYIRSISLQP